MEALKKIDNIEGSVKVRNMVEQFIDVIQHGPDEVRAEMFKVLDRYEKKLLETHAN